MAEEVCPICRENLLPARQENKKKLRRSERLRHRNNHDKQECDHDTVLPVSQLSCCGGKFHPACLLQWLVNHQNSCPLCRRSPLTKEVSVPQRPSSSSSEWCPPPTMVFFLLACGTMILFVGVTIGAIATVATRMGVSFTTLLAGTYT